VPLTRTRRGTRHEDAPHVLVRRTVTPASVAAAAAVAAGWLAFAVSVLKCILSTPHP